MLVHALIRPTTQPTAEIVEAVAMLETAGVGALVIDRGATLSAYEPTTLAGLLARQTTRMGLVVADTVHVGHPYNVARRLASLDHVSRGRAGWLVAAEASDADVGGFEHSGAGPEEAEHAVEFRTVVEKLWLSWERGAEQPDKASGRYQDDTRIHPIGYRTARFQVAGALNVPRSPQGMLPVVTVARTAAQVRAAIGHVDAVILEPSDLGDRDGLLALAREEFQAAARPARILVGVTAVDGAVSAPSWERELITAGGLGADGVAVVGDGSLGWATQVVGALDASRTAAAGPVEVAPAGRTLAGSLGLTTEGTTEWSAA